MEKSSCSPLLQWRALRVSVGLANGHGLEDDIVVCRPNVTYRLTGTAEQCPLDIPMGDAIKRTMPHEQ